MELQYFGANAFKVSAKKTTLVVDPVSDISNVAVDCKKVDVIASTQQPYLVSSAESSFVIDGPGEYEFEEFSIKGVAAQPQTASTGDNSATVYRVSTGDVTVLFLGNIDAKLSEDQLESIGLVDVVVVPVGGTGYTLDSVGAASLVRAVEPKLVVPSVYADGGKYEMPLQELSEFTKELGAPVLEVVDKLKLKTLPEQLSVQPLSRS